MNENDGGKKYSWPYGLLGELLRLAWKIFLFLIWLLAGEKIEEWIKRVPRKTLGFWKGKREKAGGQEEEYRINSDVFQWFQEKWLAVQTGSGQEETGRIPLESKVKFCQWLKANYESHLYKHKKNKKEYFENSRKQSLYEAVLHGVNRIVIAIIECLIVVLSSAAVLGFIWEVVKSLVYGNHDQSEIWSRSVWLLFVSVFIFILVGLKILFSAEYMKRLDDIEQKRETWLRHEKAIREYQYEMINYIMDSQEYREVLLARNKEKLFIDRVVNVWQRNGKQFQKNMKKKDRTKKEKKNKDGATIQLKEEKKNDTSLLDRIKEILEG